MVQPPNPPAERPFPSLSGIKQKAKYTQQWLQTSWTGFRNRRLFADLEAYCLFVGPRRSGTTLLGQLLNAHPDVVIAHQLYALEYLSGWTRNQHIQRILNQDREFVSRRKCRWNGYDYSVPGQWQGRVRTLKVVGDKGADRATRSIERDPAVLDRLQRKVGVPIKLVMVVRNPFDVIGNYRKHGLHPSTQAAIDDFFARCAACAELRSRVRPEHWFQLPLESLVREPSRVLRELCGFLGVECSDEYLDACSRAVFTQPKATRRQLEWPADAIRQIESRSATHDFLSAYSFDHSPA